MSHKDRKLKKDEKTVSFSDLSAKEEKGKKKSHNSSLNICSKGDHASKMHASGRGDHGFLSILHSKSKEELARKNDNKEDKSGSCCSLAAIDGKKNEGKKEKKNNHSSITKMEGSICVEEVSDVRKRDSKVKGA